ncbi:WD repeat-containing protein 43-like [Papaver somniferum]|uniref:WD repeat-containing protein 43-like n=1 Tax=Papaver somniferum TaxID=3469 RepID=UPI000E6FF408|nr:WD repeat-containing protein 43-like [Papaver somniferum]
MGAEKVDAVVVDATRRKKKEKKKMRPASDLDAPTNIEETCHDDVKGPATEEKLVAVVVDASRKKKKEKKEKKKRAASDLDAPTNTEEACHDDDKGPTIEEKLASINLTNDNKSSITEDEEPSTITTVPSADSVHVLLKQALHADDRVLLLDCLYTQDEKVIANSISLLHLTDALKLLDALLVLTQSRGAVLACALPWLKNLLLQHSSSITSKESSLRSLNSLYQLIDSRVSTYRPALQLSSCLDYLFTEISDDADDETIIAPIIYEDFDDSELEESEDVAMDTDPETEKQHEEVAMFSDYDECDEMSDD